MLATEQILLKDRIRHLLHIKKCTISSLAENETERVRISRQINGDANVTIDTIRLILFSFPAVSADWLILGEGQMDKSNHFAPHVHVAGGGSAFINEHGVNIGTQKSDPIIIPTKDELEKLMRSPEGFFSIRTIFDAKDDAIAQRDAIIHTLRDQIAQLTKDKELLSNLLSSLTSQSQSISSDLPNQSNPIQSSSPKFQSEK